MENLTQPSSQQFANSAREKLSSYLGNQMKVVISDGRVLIGEFMCTDKDRNLILGNCDEYIPMNVVQTIDDDMGLNNKQEGLSRMLSLAIIPGHHITSIAVAKGKSSDEPLTDPSSLKHQNQHEDRHDDQHEDQYEDQHESQHENQHEDKYEDQHESQHRNEDRHKDQHASQHEGQHENQHKDEQKIQDENKHESQYENQNQHKAQNRSQHGDQLKDHENQHSKEHESEGTRNITDAYTEEHGQTEDIHTPQKHLTKQ